MNTKRFEIENGYQHIEAMRLRTTLSNLALRLMIVGIVLVLLNVWAQWQYLRKPGHGPRRVDHAIFCLRRFQTFLLTAVAEIHVQLSHISSHPTGWLR